MKVCSGKKLARYKFQIQNWLYTLLRSYPFKCCVKKVTTQVVDLTTENQSRPRKCSLCFAK